MLLLLSGPRSLVRYTRTVLDYFDTKPCSFNAIPARTAQVIYSIPTVAETFPGGHSSVVPLAAAIPTSHSSYEMRPINDNKYRSLEHDPISPLSSQSDEEFPTNREVSPLTSPTRPQPIAASSLPHYHPLPDIYAIPQRKPMGRSNLHSKGTIVNDRLAMHSSSPQISVPSNDVGPRAEARKKFGQSPRSQSVRAPIRPTQGATIRTTCRRRPRSQSVPPAPRHQAIPVERRLCAHVSYVFSLNSLSCRPHCVS